MDSISDLFPALDLFFRPDSTSSEERLAVNGDRRAFSEDEASGSSLGVVFGMKFGGDAVFRVGSATGHGGHDDSVAEGEVTEFIGLEEEVGSFVAHGSCMRGKILII